MNKVVAHVDMDAFFAAIEQRDDPCLRGKPVVVGADPQKGKGRGVVSTCSYEARRYGIHSAMPISMAYRRCPQAVFLPVRMAHYAKVSGQLFALLQTFTPDVEPVSVDEAFLDLSGTEKLHGPPLAAAHKIKARIRDELHLTASIGLAPVKMVAKIASDLCKPDGLLEVQKDKMLDFLWPLPVEKLWGIGPKTKDLLNAQKIFTIGDLARMDQARICKMLGEHGANLYALAHGRDDRKIEEPREAKSVSHEHTFDQDTADKEELEKTLLVLSEKVSRRLRQDDLKGRTIAIKVRLEGFQTSTRAVTVSEPTNFVDDIFLNARRLFDSLYVQGTKVRLLGVRVSGFADPYAQASLFEDKAKDRHERMHKAVDLIKDKFGESSIHRAL